MEEGVGGEISSCYDESLKTQADTTTIEEGDGWTNARLIADLINRC